MTRDATNLVGMCGLYCGTCPLYLAYQENDFKEMERISQRSNSPVEEIRCYGCLSDNIFPLCLDCRHGFRRCATAKQVTWCFQCPEFPCQRLEDFKNIHVVNGISHHAHVIDDLRDIKEHGIEPWIDKQERAGRCQECGKRLYWFANECPNCHTQVR